MCFVILLIGCATVSKTTSGNANGPVITNITPQTGDSNTQIEVRGMYFGSHKTDASEIIFHSATGQGSQRLRPDHWSDTSISVRLYDNTLANYPSGYFVVRVGDRTSNHSAEFSSDLAFSDTAIEPSQIMPFTGHKLFTVTGSGFGTKPQPLVLADFNNFVQYYEFTPGIWRDNYISFTLDGTKMPSFDNSSGGQYLRIHLKNNPTRVLGHITYQKPSHLIPMYSGNINGYFFPGNEIVFTGTSNPFQAAPTIKLVNTEPSSYYHQGQLSWSSGSYRWIIPNNIPAGTYKVVILFGDLEQEYQPEIKIVQIPAIAYWYPGNKALEKGDTVTIVGNNFGSTQGDGRVHIYLQGSSLVYPVTYTSWSNNMISFVWNETTGLFGGEKPFQMRVYVNGIESTQFAEGTYK